MSRAVSPASRMAAVAASVANEAGVRPPWRLKPVEPTPTMATWSLMGLRAIPLLLRRLVVRRLEHGERRASPVDPRQRHREPDPQCLGWAVHDRGGEPEP